MKKCKSVAVFFLLVGLVLSMCGCSDYAPEESNTPSLHTDPAQIVTEPSRESTEPVDISTLWTQGKSPVPNDRTGIKRQCIHTLKAYEVTETGIYFLPQGYSFIIYADHDSDTFVKLCGRPDCPHNNSTCDAYFDNATNLCYYNGYLYVLDFSGLLRMNLDGTDRTRVFSYSEIGAYQGVSTPDLYNGLLSFGLKSVNSSGQEICTLYYYFVDGSMQKPSEGGLALPVFNHNGKFYGYTANSEGNLGYEEWDPKTNTTSYVCDFVEGGGYLTESFSIQLQGSNVCCYTYADKNFTPLFDTGLEGELFLHCFPDCMVVSQKLGDKYSLYFYDWSYVLLGSIEIQQEVTLWGQSDLICGETEGRIMISVSSTGLPEYYIDKSEFEGGNIKLYKYDLPALEWEYVQP